MAGTKGRVNTKTPSLREMWSIKWVTLRCSIVGTIVGILPGAGATIASFMRYAMENKLSKYPEKLATGIIDGIAASETANNAATGGAMVPLLTLGIPGCNAAAVMMSALALKGVQMGPLLLTKQPEFLSATFITMIITNILMVVVAMGIAKVFAQILAIPYSYLGPIILMLATIGSYSEGGFVGVQVMVLAGVLGVVVKYMHLNSAAIVLGLVLGGMCEEHFSRAYLTDRANVGKALFGTPIAAVVMTACILMLLSPLYMPWIKKLISRKKPNFNNCPCGALRACLFMPAARSAPFFRNPYLLYNKAPVGAANHIWRLL
ncbi:MAG: tripartite tricarboxylate transporter permease [Christensenellales bacterium]